MDISLLYESVGKSMLLLLFSYFTRFQVSVIDNCRSLIKRRKKTAIWPANAQRPRCSSIYWIEIVNLVSSDSASHRININSTWVSFFLSPVSVKQQVVVRYKNNTCYIKQLSIVQTINRVRIHNSWLIWCPWCIHFYFFCSAFENVYQLFYSTIHIYISCVCALQRSRWCENIVLN